MANPLTHFDSCGATRMVDVSGKEATQREARASARITMQADTMQRVRDHRVAKGDVLEVARLAGIMAAKRTADLIPLCHPLPLEATELTFTFPDTTTLQLEATVRVHARTGVEMEAMTAVTVAALTVYDMCKSADRLMVIQQIRLEEKSGGRSGHFLREGS